MQEQEYGAATHVGCVRNNNEDCFLARPEASLWLVADGMGGAAAGEVASGIVRDTVLQSVNHGEELEASIQTAHEAVIRAVEEQVGEAGMGSTVVALQSQGSNARIAWVGDSRAYRWRDGELEQLTRDHSYVQSLIDAGIIDAEDAENHPQKNVITQSLGAVELNALQIDSIETPWQSGDKLLLCSDGLTGEVNDAGIANILSEGGSDQEVVDRLIQAALDNGGHDNVSVIIVSAPAMIDTNNTAGGSSGTAASSNSPPVSSGKTMLLSGGLIVVLILLIFVLQW